MQLTEQHVIKHDDPRFAVIDASAFQSKNLYYLHTASRWIIEDLVAQGIGSLIIGKNDGWKQEANMGTRNNQNFVQIPHARFVSMLIYKAERVGMRMILPDAPLSILPIHAAVPAALVPLTPDKGLFPVLCSNLIP